jgi:predicted enzyme related to lactoylglutathione lyase
MSSRGADRKIDYIEFNVADIARSKAFYGSAFGWTFTDYGPEYCEFQDGRLTGGFTTTAPVRAHGGPLIILFADALEEILARVEAAGGKVVQPIFDFPGGRRFHFTDPDGYELAVWSDR